MINLPWSIPWAAGNVAETHGCQKCTEDQKPRPQRLREFGYNFMSNPDLLSNTIPTQCLLGNVVFFSPLWIAIPARRVTWASSKQANAAEYSLRRHTAARRHMLHNQLVWWITLTSQGGTWVGLHKDKGDIVSYAGEDTWLHQCVFGPLIQSDPCAKHGSIPHWGHQCDECLNGIVLCLGSNF